MVYSNKFVLSVLVNGHPQAELSNGVVPLPFDAEYVLRFRNKHNRRAVVKFTIDGENVSGSGYIIDANSHIDIKRHRDVDRAFKFVSLESEDAIDHGKNGPNDDKVKGTIEARFYLEKERPKYTPPTYVPYPVPAPYPVPQPYPVWPRPHWTQEPYRCLHQTTICDSSRGGGTTLSFNAGVAPASGMAPPLQDGCTVEGSMTGQGFYSEYIDTEDNCTILRVFLQGKQTDAPVSVKPVVRPRKEDSVVTDLEAENERLRKELAEEENRLLKEKLAALKEPAKKASVKRTVKKKTTKKE